MSVQAGDGRAGHARLQRCQRRLLLRDLRARANTLPLVHRRE